MITPVRGSFLVLLGSFAMAASAAMISYIGAEPISTAAWRCLLAVPMLAPFVLWELKRVKIPEALPKRTLIGAALGGIAIGIDYGFYNISIMSVGAGIATVLINIQVVVLPLFAWAIEGKRPAKALAGIIPVMLIGVALTAGAFGSAQLSLFGVIAGLIAGLGYATYLGIIRRTAASTLRPAPLTVLSIVCLSAGVTTFIAAAVSGRLEFPDSGEQWLWFLALAFVGQVVVYLCLNIAMTGLPETLSSALMLTGPIFALGLGALFFTEIPTGWQIIGCAMIILGAWWTGNSQRRAHGGQPKSAE